MLSNLQEDIHDALLKKWLEFPNLRFAQLIVNILGTDPYYLQDREVLKRINLYPTIDRSDINEISPYNKDKNEIKETLWVVVPEKDDDVVSAMLRKLTQAIDKKNSSKTAHGILGGEYGYGCEYEDEMFMMHPYCWCDRKDCDWCESGRANFEHKASGLSIHWYKYIGRGMEVHNTSGKEAWKIIVECIDHIEKGG